MEGTNSTNGQLKFVLLTVLVLCGGNGVGIIAAALVWKATASVKFAILTLVAITVVALVSALAMIVIHIKNKGKSDPSGQERK